MNNQKALTEGPVRKQLIKMTLSMLMGMLGMSLFNLTDTFFIAKIGSNELAAMNFTMPVVFMVANIALGLGLGASSVISRAIGQGKAEKVKRLTTDSLLLSILIIIVISILGYTSINPLFKMLGAPSELIPLIREYMTVWFIGMPFLVIPMVGNSIIRATGDVFTPSKIMLSGFLLNFILDPILIFGIGPISPLGLKGAAIATVVARASTFVLTLYILHVKKHMISFKIPSMAKIVSSWKELLYIGLPAAATQSIMPLSIGIITKIISMYGIEAIAAYGVALRIEMLAMTMIWAFSSVINPFVGQNWGANLVHRIQTGIRFGNIFSVVWGFLMFLLFLIFADPLMSFFNREAAVVNIGKMFLIIVSLSYGCKGIVMFSSSACSAVKRPFSAAILSLLQMIILRMPFALIGSYFIGIKGLFIGIVLADFISSLISIVRVKSIFKISKAVESLA